MGSCWSSTLLAVALAAPVSGGGQEPSAREAAPSAPQAAPAERRAADEPAPVEATAKAPPPPLRLDVARAVEDVMARVRSGELPHFEERIEVRDRYQEALEAQLAGVDLECGATSGGPPTSAELRNYGGATIPPHADFIAAGKLVYKGLKKLFGSKQPRFFVYAVRRGFDVSYAVREGPVPEAVRNAAPQVGWDLLAAFHERDEAVAAVQRLQRGFPTPQRAHEDAPLPPWVSSTCRPKGFGQ